MLRVLSQPRRAREGQLNVAHPQPRDATLPSGSESFSEQGRVGGHEDELISSPAKQLADRLDRAKIGQRQMEDPAAIAKEVACRGITTLETIWQKVKRTEIGFDDQATPRSILLNKRTNKLLAEILMTIPTAR